MNMKGNLLAVIPGIFRGIVTAVEHGLMLLILAICCTIHVANADPFAAPGDLRLRHDLQLLADSGLLNIPLTSWPIPWGDISNALADRKKVHNPAVLASWRRVHHRIDLEFSEHLRLKTRLASAASPERFRTFTDTPRSTVEAGMTASMMSDYWAIHLEGTAVVRKPRDHKRWRPDGSYASGILGNWIFTAGWQDRWWGPGWDGSLIMSNNTRPMPAISISRNASEPFDLPVLRWLGPWQLRMFQGRLEGNRFVPHTLLTGMRLSFKPVPNLEIGMSRGIQWGGTGRPQGFSTFLRALAGRDNVGQKGVTSANQPGNQLAGFDARWTSPLFNLPYAIYTQWIGEDESHGAPIQYMAIMGGEIWGSWSDAGASWRLHVEYADTAAHLLGGSLQNRNVAYVHAIYRSGYRYYSRSLGHSIDGDGRSLSLGATLVDGRGGTWEALLRGMRTNQDNISPGTVKIPAEQLMGLQLRTIQQFGSSRVTLGIGVSRDKQIAANITDTVLHSEIQLETTF